MIKDRHILRYLDGTATVQLTKDVDNWIALNNENREIFNLSKLIWDISSKLKSYIQFNTDGEWEKFDA